MSYPSFAKDDAPKAFNYDTSELTENGFQYRLEVDNRNPDFKKFCEEQTNGGKQVKVIDLAEPNKVHVWVK